MPHPITRRATLKALAAGGLAAALPTRAFAHEHATSPAWLTPVLSYLNRLARPDGGYAWEDQERSHLTPTFAVIACYRHLNQTPPNKAQLADFVRTHHPAKLKKLEQEHREFEYQQIQSLLWLGEDASSFAPQVRAWRTPTIYLKQYERDANPILRHELTAFTCRHLLGLPLDDLTPAYVEYLDHRRRPNGSFNNTPATDGSDGHVMNTWWGLEALHVLKRTHERKDETIAWLRACQLPSGGFTFQPRPQFAGTDDVAYTCAALRALKLLGSAPSDPAACLQYLHRLWNPDGGFTDRPGWASNPVATYYALDALSALSALHTPPPEPKAPPTIVNLPSDLKVFSIQIEAHGKGSPAEAVDLARSLGIHLWGAKNATPEWLARCQSIADQQRAPVKFFSANEEYGTWVTIPGMGTYSHTSDIIAPPDTDFGASLANKGAVPWTEFRERRLTPLLNANGRLVWQFGENELLVRMLLDDSLQRPGYAAISTFHFGNPDFTNSEPFLMRYRGRIPFVALHDAHGNEPWWFADMTTGFRTLFLATEPTWEAWLDALKHNRVAAVRHDAASNFKTWIHAPSREVLDHVRRHEPEWRWWDNPRIARPLVSIVAITPDDPFESPRPKQGLTIRVRCAWENTTQGFPKKPLAELQALLIDDKQVEPTLLSPRQPRGPNPTDYAHCHQIPNPTPGPHRATATIRELASNKETTRTLDFTV
jgi:hypothetical protein